MNTEKGKVKKYGNVYEIILPNNKYIYVCWLGRFHFGFFNYYSEEATTDLNKLLSAGFKMYKSGKETAITKKIWRLIGHIDLEEENIKFPDLPIFLSYNKEYFIECSRIMRDGNPYVVPLEYYISLLKKGYVYGFFDNYKNFELWLSNYFENYPEVEGIFPLPDKYR